jgi:carbonic anhydrase
MPDALLPADLLAGYASFRAGSFLAARDRYRQLAEAGQQPATMVVGCSDSRSSPEAIFDAGPGELFVVRNVGALVPRYAPDATLHGVSAALEYAVLALEVRSIVVMGHGRCGGIAAALDSHSPLSDTDFVGRWVASLRDLAAELDATDPVGDRAGGDDAAPNDAARRLALERHSVEQSLDNLRTFPWLTARESSGALTLHGAWFDIGLGELHAVGDDGWVRVDAGEAAAQHAGELGELDASA